MDYTDTHAHIDGPEFDADRDEVVARARAVGVSRVFVPAINLDSVSTVLATCEHYPGFAYPMIGLHPEEVRTDFRDVLARMRTLADSRFIAIGEVGLDFYWSREFEKEQLEAFEEQVRWAVELRLPLMIHCRKGQNEMVGILRRYAGDVKVWVGRYKNLTNLPHWHDDCEVIFAVTGGAKVTVGSETFELDEGRAAFIAPRSVHCIRGETGSVLAFILFDKRPVRNVLEGRTLRTPLLGCDYALESLYDKLDEELSSGSQLCMLSVVNRIERLVLDIFSREAPGKEKEADRMEERYRLLLDDIDEKYADYSVEDAATFTAISVSYFSRFFKRMANMNFSRYLNLVRTEKAIEMIRAGQRKMTDIAIACGFGTIRSFNRVFHEITGFSPRNLPTDYNALSLHPVYTAETSFDPTSDDAELL